MMPLPRFVFVLFWACIVVAGDALAEAVEDGDWERGNLTFAEGDEPGVWVRRIHGAANVSLDIVSGEGRNGGRCLRYSRPDGASKNIHVDQMITVVPETIYELRAWVRSDGALNPVIVVQTTDWKTLAMKAAGIGKEWREVRFLFSSYENTQVRLEWFPGADGKLYRGLLGTAFLDDVSVKPVQDVGKELRRAFALGRIQKGKEIDLQAVERRPVGRARPLRSIHCRDGLLLYEDGTEVALWGVNLQTALSWEWRGRLCPIGLKPEIEEMKRLTDENLTELQALGVEVLRLHLLPTDFSHKDGTVKDSFYLHALDYLISRCAEEGIYVYLTLINYMQGAPKSDSFPLERERQTWIFDPEFVAAAERYADSFLRRRNRYNGAVYASDPTIAVVELINEPGYPAFEDLEEFSVVRREFQKWCEKRGVDEHRERYFYNFRYDRVADFLKRMCATLREAGADKPVVWNLNWTRMIRRNEEIFQAVADSPVDAVSFCLYPGQSDVPHPFWAHPANLTERNYLPYLEKAYKDYFYLRWILGTRFAGKAKLVYEFETMYNQSAYLYPAMAALFRALGVQIAPMWQYTLSPAAQFIGGSHYLNLFCTPAKAVSFRAAGEVFRTTPRFTPLEIRDQEKILTSSWESSFPNRASVFSNGEIFLHAGAAAWSQLRPQASVKTIMGCGDSDFVSYDGSGSYTITIGEDEIQVDIRPDIHYHYEPWKRLRKNHKPQRLCSLKTDVEHTFSLRLPGWDEAVEVSREESPTVLSLQAEKGSITWSAKPGVYQIRRRK